MTGSAPRDRADDGAHADPMPAPPLKPGAAECCESACERCVFDVYADELEAYRQALARWRARHPDAPPAER